MGLRGFGFSWVSGRRAFGTPARRVGWRVGEKKDNGGGLGFRGFRVYGFRFRGFRVLWLRVLGLRFRGSGVQGFRVEV